MTRVLMTADAVGGVWTYALELARALESRHVATTLAVLGPAPSNDQLADAARVPSLDVATGNFALEWMLDVADFDRQVEASGCWLIELAREVRPDIVHLNGFAGVELS